MWTKEQLREAFQEKMADYRLIVVSNRQPYSHTFRAGQVVCQRQPGGLVTALNPVLQAVDGTWIALGDGFYDRRTLGESGKVMVPPEGPAYSLKRVFLSKDDRRGYYHGYCNEGLWPLCHVTYTRPIFRAPDWEAYRRVNRMFADAILQEVGNQNAFVWVQDFHLTLVAKYLQESYCPNIITSLFWHIPWPNFEVFSICPQKREILEGMLAYDLLGFQTRYHCDHFLSTIDRELESRIDREKGAVRYQNHETQVRAFPISVDFEAITAEAESPELRSRCELIRRKFNLQGKKILLGVDRLDYTKGIPDRLRAIDRFLEKYPEFRQSFVFYQLGQLSRVDVQRYKELNEELAALTEEINRKHREGDWVPVIFDREEKDYRDILALYRMTDVCIVSSLHDGMNLVAKEYVAAQPDLNGVLILSEFTGASRELSDAVLVNPYDYESFADTLAAAMNMPAEEKEKRMRKMRDTVQQHNIYRWAGKNLSELLKFEFQEA